MFYTTVRRATHPTPRPGKSGHRTESVPEMTGRVVVLVVLISHCQSWLRPASRCGDAVPWIGLPRSSHDRQCLQIYCSDIQLGAIFLNVESF
ncbi:hypothetical protein E2C01_080920 [Portunus trituberculatus]|uniref:Uncharacterized protein n=1 Tax=Portunus trituberculatus TaxID=210409 RepID=A0A5B7J0V8_PORTR|nr:hypothetical protein [Portunus trituberculatus]